MSLIEINYQLAVESITFMGRKSYSDRSFRAWFGVSLAVISDIWGYIAKGNLDYTPSMIHLLTEMYFMKNNPRDETHMMPVTIKTAKIWIRNILSLMDANLPEVNIFKDHKFAKILYFQTLVTLGL